MNLSNEQKKAYDLIVNNKNTINIGGYAGTGKTFLLGQVATKLANEGKKVLITCFTGKAAQKIKTVVQPHGNIDIKNFHQVVYRVVKSSSDRLVVTKRDQWFKNYDIVLVDESSMIDSQTISDIVEGNLPTTFFGDPFQLPPIDGETVITGKHDIVLKDVFRQDSQSLALKVATDLRNGIDSTQEIERLDRSEVFNQNFDYQAIFFTNKERHKFNRAYREYVLNVEFDFPISGDSLICVQNNHFLDLYNGSQFTVASSEVLEYEGIYFALIYTEIDNVVTSFLSPVNQFYSNTVQKLKNTTVNGIPIVYSDYSYGITCHKAQGSEFDHVVSEFPYWFKRRDEQFFYRWLYTAITRTKGDIYFI